MKVDNIKNYLQFNYLYSKEDIEKIINTIINDNIFNSYEGILFKKKNNYFMGFNFKNNKIEIDYDFLIKEINNNYKKVNNLIPYIVYFNLSIILFIFHEFIHIRQLDEYLNNTLLGELYGKSINFVIQTKQELKILYNTIYLNYHDYFITEINANYEAIYLLIKLLIDNNIDYYQYYVELFISHLNDQYSFSDYDYFHNLIIKDLDLIKEVSECYDEETIILNGIKRVNISHSRELSKLLHIM